MQRVTQYMTHGQMLVYGAALYFLVLLAYSTFYSYKVANWPFVKGRLILIYVSTFDFDSYENLRYEYEVDGVSYIGTRLSPIQIRGQVKRKIKKQMDKIEYLTNDEVKVFFDPKKPSKSYLVRESWLDIFRL